VDERMTVRWQIVNREFYRCNLNGDSLTDYALEVVVGESSCMVEYFIALVANNQSYEFHLLCSSPASRGLAGRTKNVLRRAGDKVSNYDDDDGTDEPQAYVLPTDAIEFVPMIGCCSTIFIYSDHTFNMFTSGD
jgi:hypothetical protein